MKGQKTTSPSSEPARWSCDKCQRMSDFHTCQSNHTYTDGFHKWQASVKLCKIYCDIWQRLTWSVYTGGRAVVRYIMTKFSRMDILPNFVTHSAPLRARECSAITQLKYGHALMRVNTSLRSINYVDPHYASKHAIMVIPTSHWTSAYPSVMWFGIGINNYREKWRILSVWKISYFSNNEWVSLNVQIDH